MNEARDVMHRADGLRQRARALQSMQVRMRVRERPMQTGSHFWFRKRREGEPSLELTPQEDQLFYEWCSEKQREYEAEADRLDATLEVRDDR